MANYFNSLNLREKLDQMGRARFMDRSEFSKGTDALKGKKIVIVGCGAQGLNQGLNMRDSGLDVSYALRKQAIDEKRPSYQRATENGFKVGTFEEMIPQADLVINLAPDKQHSDVVQKIQPLMKKGAALGYSHGLNIVEAGEPVRKDITVIMMAPKGPGNEVREEYKRGFGVPTLIAVHPENDPEGKGWDLVKAWASGTGGDRAGVLESSFVAEVKTDLMGEQTILCGLLQAATILCYDRLISDGAKPAYAAKLIQYGWETITESLKHGGITLMMDRLSNPAKIRADKLSEELKTLMRPLFRRHMDDIISGKFAETMMADWKNDDHDLLTWRAEHAKAAFEHAPDFKNDPGSAGALTEQDYYENGIVMVAFAKAGIELAFETMVQSGFKPESAYYESLHELPLIAYIIGDKRLHGMNVIISDTAEYGNYLFANDALPLLKDFVKSLKKGDLGQAIADDVVDNIELRETNEKIRNHPIEIVGRKMRGYMTDMKRVSVGG